MCVVAFLLFYLIVSIYAQEQISMHQSITTTTTTNNSKQQRYLEAITSTSTEDQTCEKYKDRSLLDNTQMFSRNQTLLLSYPGSGNSWVRLLIESATGIYTGSIYTDETLSPLFPTEDRCGLRLSVIKGHPRSFETCDNYLCIKKSPAHTNRKYYLKCLGGTIQNFKKFLFVARDPMMSIWSEFQLIVSGQHNESVRSNDRNMIRYWQTHAKRAIDSFANDYHQSVYPMYVNHSPHNFKWIKYESLLDETTRVSELHQVTEYLQLPNPVNLERVTCAFDISDNVRIHRHSVYNATEMIHNHLISMACYAWARIGNYSRTFGYSFPWPQVVCES